MSEARITFDSKGFRKILFSSGVKEVLEKEAEKIQSRANSNNKRGGAGFSANVWKGSYGGGRLVASVSTTDRKSIIAESEDKALSKAVKG